MRNAFALRLAALYEKTGRLCLESPTVFSICASVVMNCLECLAYTAVPHAYSYGKGTHDGTV